jgi:hypothetical protein
MSNCHYLGVVWPAELQPGFGYDVHGIGAVAVFFETGEAPETVGVSALAQK